MKRVVLCAAASLLVACSQKAEPPPVAAAPTTPEVTSPSPVEQVADIGAVKNAIGSRLEAASAAKAAVSEHYAAAGAFPADCGEIGNVCPEYVTLGDGGVIDIDLQSTGVADLAGASIRLTPEATPEFDVNWTCSSNAPPRFLPPQCMNEMR